MAFVESFCYTYLKNCPLILLRLLPCCHWQLGIETCGYGACGRFFDVGIRFLCFRARERVCWSQKVQLFVPEIPPSASSFPAGVEVSRNLSPSRVRVVDERTSRVSLFNEGESERVSKPQKNW